MLFLFSHHEFFPLLHSLHLYLSTYQYLYEQCKHICLRKKLKDKREKEVLVVCLNILKLISYIIYVKMRIKQESGKNSERRIPTMIFSPSEHEIKG